MYGDIHNVLGVVYLFIISCMPGGSREGLFNKIILLASLLNTAVG